MWLIAPARVHYAKNKTLIIVHAELWVDYVCPVVPDSEAFISFHPGLNSITQLHEHSVMTVQNRDDF